MDEISVRVLPDGRMTRPDAARYLGYRPKTLAMWKLQGKGPESVKVGGRVFYFLEALDAFIKGQVAQQINLANGGLASEQADLANKSE